MRIPGHRSGRSEHEGEARGEAFIRQLYNEHGRGLLAYATRLTSDRSAAEDVVQETLLRAWQHADSLSESKGSIRAWLFTVARNIVTDRARARSARPPEVSETPGSQPTEPDHADSVVKSVVVLDALGSLSTDHRNVLVELYFRHRTVDEAAAALGVPPGTVKSRSHYALRALRAALEPPKVGTEEVAGT